MNKLISFGAIAAVTAACATKTVTFRTEGKARASLVTFDNLEQVQSVLGDMPVTVKIDDLKGKAVKIEAEGKRSVYWLVPEVAGEQTEMTVKLHELEKDKSPAAPASNEARSTPVMDFRASTNRMMRILMKAYRALASKQFQLANELADQATKMDPEIAAAFVIKGISLAQSGDSNGANAAFVKAKALDPEDNDIDRSMLAVGLGAAKER